MLTKKKKSFYFYYYYYDNDSDHPQTPYFGWERVRNETVNK